MATMMATMLAASGMTAGAAAGAAGAATAAAGTSTLMNAITIGTTLVSGLAALQSGGAQAAGLQGQANMEDFRAKQEEIKGMEETARAMGALNDDLGKAIVAGYANGLQGSGSVETAIREAREEGQFNINMSRDNAVIQSSLRKSNAQQLRQSASSSRAAGIWEAVGIAGKGATSYLKRG
jgi:hypothetical protein